MLRHALRAILFLAFAAAVLESTSRAQPPSGAERIYYRDKKDGQIKDLPAELKVSPTGFQVIAASDKKVVATITAADIVRIVPADIPGYDLKGIMEPVNFEIKKDWEKARLGHVEILKKSGSAPEKVSVCWAESAGWVDGDDGAGWCVWVVAVVVGFQSV